jgi:hypothetical protein
MPHHGVFMPEKILLVDDETDFLSIMSERMMTWA